MRVKCLTPLKTPEEARRIFNYSIDGIERGMEAIPLEIERCKKYTDELEGQGLVLMQRKDLLEEAQEGVEHAITDDTKLILLVLRELNILNFGYCTNCSIDEPLCTVVKTVCFVETYSSCI